MADEDTSTPTVQAEPSASPAAPEAAPSTAPEQPSIGDLLNWDAERGEMPAEHRALLTPEAIKSHYESEISKAREETAADAARREAQRAADEQVRRDGAAKAQQDLDFYTGLKARLNSDDAATREAAVKELNDNEDRYNNGSVIARQQSEETVSKQAFASLFRTMQSELTAAGLEGILPVPQTPEWTKFAVDLAEYDEKGGLAAYLIDKGKAMGVDEGRRLEREESARTTRIEDGKGGGPEGGRTSDGGTRHGDEAWVRAQIAADPHWRMKPSDERDAYGRPLTNNDLVLRELAAKR